MKKNLVYLMLFSLVACGQAKKEVAVINSQTNEEFIKTLVVEPVFEYNGKDKEVVFPTEMMGLSVFIEVNKKPEFDKNYNLLNGEPFKALKGKKIMFTGINKDNYLFTIDGKKYKVVVTNKAEIGNKEFYTLFDAAYVEKIKKGLEGKRLYTKTSEWIYKTENKSTNEIENEKSCKYCPVTITRVEKAECNNYAVYFKRPNNDQEYYMDVVLDKDRSYSFKVDLMEQFTEKLSFENPQKKPDNVSEKTWENIQNLKIEKGMTKEDIELMLGKPDEVLKGDLLKENQEAWYYSNVNRKEYSVLFTNNKVEKYIEGKY